MYGSQPKSTQPGQQPTEEADPDMQALAQQRLQLRRARTGAPQTQITPPGMSPPSELDAPPPGPSPQMTTQQRGTGTPMSAPTSAAAPAPLDGLGAIAQQRMRLGQMAMQPNSASSPFVGVNRAGQQSFGGPANPNLGGGPPSMPSAPTAPTVNPTITPAPTATTATTAPSPADARAAAMSPADARAAAIEQAKQKSAAHGGVYDPTGKGNDLTDLAGLRRQQQQQMAALKDQLAADRAHAEQNAAAASGLGGFGLSGASATLQSDIGRTQDRTATQAEGDLASQQATDQFRLVQRQAALNDLEASTGEDLNGDGKIGGAAVGGDDDPNKPKTGITFTDPNSGQVDQSPAIEHNAPVTNKDRTPVPDGTDMSHIKDGSFTKGDGYFGSDDKYDYYQSAKNGAYYRVAR